MEQLFRSVKASERLPDKEGRSYNLRSIWNRSFRTKESMDKYVSENPDATWLEVIEPSKSAEEFLNGKAQNIGYPDFMDFISDGVNRANLIEEWMEQYAQSKLPSEEEAVKILWKYRSDVIGDLTTSIDITTPKAAKAILKLKR